MKKGKYVMEELISVVVPIYNVKKYLSKCIESIINQSYSNLEILLVDDGSKDSSGIICDDYAKKDNRIKVIHKKNEGLSSARNIGIDKAKGKYIIFIDGDDWINEKMIEILYDIIKVNNSDISICDYFLAYNEETQVQKEEIEIITFSNIEALKKLYDKDLGTDMTLAWNKLYKRNLFDRDIRYPYGKIHEDEFTTYKLLYKAKRISYTNQRIYYYRQREDSIMHSKVNEKCLDALQALEERLDFIKNNVENEEIYNLTAKAYYMLILNRYYLLIKHCKYKQECLNNLKKKARSFYKINKNKLKWTFKLSIIYKSFLISTKLYVMIEDYSRNRPRINLNNYKKL